jgi:hypothetical protein
MKVNRRAVGRDQTQLCVWIDVRAVSGEDAVL